MEIFLHISTVILVLSLGIFVLARWLLKRAEAKARQSKRQLAITLKDYALILRIYRDILKAKKEGTYEEYKVPLY
jgi:uncharacterized membrane protein YozB (DUF420 family)